MTEEDRERSYKTLIITEEDIFKGLYQLECREAILKSETGKCEKMTTPLKKSKGTNDNKCFWKIEPTKNSWLEDYLTLVETRHSRENNIFTSL